jgi:urease accessory protein
MIESSQESGTALLRLMQLVSPALPVGAYAYSQGMEYAVHAAWLQDEASVARWILGLLQNPLSRLDVPVLARLYAAWESSDRDAVEYWSAFLSASRESRELQDEDRQLGMALARLLKDLGIEESAAWVNHPKASLATLFSLAAFRWQVPLVSAAQGYLWAWTENQVAAAIKLVPLGQTAGQRILSQASAVIPAAVNCGLVLNDEDIVFVSQRLAMGSALHEEQYSRLFRS